MSPDNKLQPFRHFLQQGSYRSLRRPPQCCTSSLKLLSRPNIHTHVTENPVRQHPMGLHQYSNDPHRHLTDLSVGKVAKRKSSSPAPSSKNSLTCGFVKVKMSPNKKLQLFRHFPIQQLPLEPSDHPPSTHTNNNTPSGPNTHFHAFGPTPTRGAWHHPRTSRVRHQHHTRARHQHHTRARHHPHTHTPHPVPSCPYTIGEFSASRTFVLVDKSPICRELFTRPSHPYSTKLVQLREWPRTRMRCRISLSISLFPAHLLKHIS